MKNLIVFLVIFLYVLNAFGEKKSKEDPRDAQIDSLTILTKNLTLQLDSVSLELVKYLGVYNTIKEKVLHYDFDPTRAAYLIDSLQTLRNATSTLVLTQSATKVVADSVTITKELKMVNIPSDELEKAQAISSLKQLKDLLDAKIITEAEFLTLKNKYLTKL